MPDSPQGLRLIKNAADQKSGGEANVPPAPGFFGLDDVGNGERFARDWKGEAMYCFEWKEWCVYESGRWKRDNTGAVNRMAKLTAKAIREEPLLDEGQRHELIKHCNASLDVPPIERMINAARSEPGMFCTPDQFEREPFLLNCLNGTIELFVSEEETENVEGCSNGANSNAQHDFSDGISITTGRPERQSYRFREARREDMLMHQIPVNFDPDAVPDVWLPVFKRMMDSDEKMMGFINRFAGLCLTGDVTDEAFFFFVGAGANGKSTFLSTLQELLGDDLATSLPVEYFLSSKNDKIPIHVHAAKGKRLVVVSENEKGAKFNAATLKMWTGDKRSGKGMRENLDSKIKPTDKIVFQTNNMPSFNDSSGGFRRRMKLTPFKVVIPEAEMDRKLKEKLREPRQLSGFLNWCLEGFAQWRLRGLDTPDTVMQASAELLAMQDVIKTFVIECLHSAHCPAACLHELPAAQFEGEKKTVYETFKRWCEDNGEGRPMSNRKFVPALKELGFLEGHSNGRLFWIGCKLKDADLFRNREEKIKAESDAAANDPLFQV